MATVTGFTATRMQEIEAASVIDGEVVGGNLILTKHDGTQINAGPVIGPVGPAGPMDTGIPGEIKLWPGAVLPDDAIFGLWTWANGGIFDIADYPIAAAHISPAWKTAMGLADPGAGKFRVPDLRGLVPAGPDAMPVGDPRANRMTRAVAITIAGKTGEETHIVSVAEMPSHNHAGTLSAVGDHAHSAWTDSQGAHAHNQQTEIYQTINTGAAATISVHKKSGGGDDVGRVTDSQGAHGHNVGIGNAGAHSHTMTINPQGSGAAHENVQPTVFVPYIVKLDD